MKLVSVFVASDRYIFDVTNYKNIKDNVIKKEVYYRTVKYMLHLY